MTAAAQLTLDVGDRRAAPIEAILLAELDHLLSNVPDPSDAPNYESHVHLVRGTERLLDWLARTDPLPDDALEWPCCACGAAPGSPCNIPGPRTKWTPPGPRYHLCRGLHGRWTDVIRRAAA